MKNKLKKFIILILCAFLFLNICIITGYAAAPTIVSNEKARIDYTDCNKTGVVKIKSLIKTDKKLKVKIIKGDTEYKYDLKNDMTEETFPLQLGDGSYKVQVWTNTKDSKYSVTLTAEIEVKLEDKNSPYINPNQQVNFTKDSKTIQKANELVKDCKTDLEKVEKIYNYVITAMTYDYDKADKAKNGELSGYVPEIDKVISSGQGICYDYASVLAAMLRSQGIPAKLVKGYVAPSGTYHAWNEFYIKGSGWFKINEMKFDGDKFERVDPTYDSTTKSNSDIIKFIGDGSNYSNKWVY